MAAHPAHQRNTPPSLYLSKYPISQFAGFVLSMTFGCLLPEDSDARRLWNQSWHGSEAS
jgi:hypothetical protein